MGDAQGRCAVIVASRHYGGLVRHVDRKGRPACGAPAHGSIVVEGVEHSTCPDCALILVVVTRVVRKGAN